MNKRSFNIVLQPEPEGGYTVVVPALPGCITYGQTIEEARENIREAILLYLEDLAANHEELPPARDDALLGAVEVEIAPAHA